MDEPLRGANPWPTTGLAPAPGQVAGGPPPAPAPSGWRLEPRQQRRLINVVVVIALLAGGFVAAKKLDAWLNPGDRAVGADLPAAEGPTGTRDDIDPAPARIGPQNAGEERAAAMIPMPPAGFKMTHDVGQATYMIGPKEIRPRTGYLRRWRTPAGVVLAVYVMEFRSDDAARDFTIETTERIDPGIKGAKGIVTRSGKGYLAAIELRKRTTSVWVLLGTAKKPTAKQLGVLRKMAKAQHRRLLAAPPPRPVLPTATSID